MNILYCTQCGHKTIKKVPKNDNQTRAVCTKCTHIHYENPKVITGIIPVIDDEILLCKRAIEPQKNKWTIPSGFMENNETVEEGALREAQEEAGITPTITQLFTLYNLPHIGQIYLLYLATLPDKTHTPGAETIESKFVKHHEIPWPDIAFASVTFALKHYITDYKSNSFHLHTGTYNNI